MFRGISWIGKYYVYLMTLTALWVLFLNFHAQGQPGIFLSYLNSKQIILSWFDSSVLPSPALTTYPIWGYGFLLILTENKIIILLLQNFLGIFSAWFLIRHLERVYSPDQPFVIFVKVLTVISVPWFAFYSLQWPFGIAISLFMISLTLLTHTFLSEEPKIKILVLSGCLFGLALNFRSDFYLMPLGFAVIVWVLLKFKYSIAVKVSIWLVSIYVLLIPWGIYTKKVSGHYLLTTTDPGAVLFTGLGLLPENKWGITPKDEDPLMHLLLKQKFGKGSNYISYESDQFLKDKFIELIMEDPLEYIRKCIYIFPKILVGGTYFGEFYESKECFPYCHDRYREHMKNIRSNIWNFFDWDIRSIITFPFYWYSGVFSKVLVFVSYLVFPFTLFYSIKNRDLFIILVLSAIAYQTTLLTLAFYMPIYLTEVYFLHVINLSLAIHLLNQRFQARKPTLT